jgi:hypothetical protein
VKFDRRAFVFLLFAVVCVVLAPVAEPRHRWVPEVTAVVYVVLAAGSLLDAWSRSRR